MLFFAQKSTRRLIDKVNELETRDLKAKIGAIPNSAPPVQPPPTLTTQTFAT